MTIQGELSGYLLGVSSQSHTLDQQPSRGNFTDKRVGNCSDRALIDARPTEHETSGGVGGGVGGARGSQSQEADHQQHDTETAETVKV